MNVKIQSSGIAGSDNTGSCLAYASYLRHENEAKVKRGMGAQQIPFYDKNAKAVSMRDVVAAIDSNRAGLHRTDAKFYSNIISFSEEETEVMGKTREERIACIHSLVAQAMDQYAIQFHSDKVSSKADLNYFYTIHEYREDNRGNLIPGLHCHIIVGRKDISNRVKLSPMTNYKEGSKGVIKRGFCRDEYFRLCEKAFDSITGYKRPIEESYDYQNTMKNGTEKEKKQLYKQRMENEEVHRQVKDALEHLALEKSTYKKPGFSLFGKKDDPEAQMNLFWNKYHTTYRPHIIQLKGLCQETFSMYADVRDKYRASSNELHDMYTQLHEMYERMNELENKIINAERSRLALYAASALIVFINPLPAAILAFAGGLVTSVNRRAGINAKIDLRRRAACIRDEIKKHREATDKLRESKNDSLRLYRDVKDDKDSFLQQLDAIKESIKGGENAVQSMEDIMVKNGYGSIRRGSFPTWKYDLNSIHQDLMSCKTWQEFDSRLENHEVSVELIYHPNGGLADMQFTGKYINSKASDLVGGRDPYRPQQKGGEMIRKWEELTGGLSAATAEYRQSFGIEPLQETREQALARLQREYERKVREQRERELNPWNGSDNELWR